MVMCLRIKIIIEGKFVSQDEEETEIVKAIGMQVRLSDWIFFFVHGYRFEASKQDQLMRSALNLS